VAERLILDTGVIVAAERGQLDLAKTAGDDDDVALPAIVVAEFLAGVHLAATEPQATARRNFIERVLGALPVEDYSRRVAERHGALLAHVRRAGTPRGAHDLIIAATALATDRTVLITDIRAGFDQLPGVKARIIAT
jgi:tRNA(fMet)-specific endonuclease VapC